MSSKDQQTEEYIKGLLIKTDKNNQHKKLEPMLQGLSDPRHGVWLGAQLPQVTLHDQHQGPEDKDAFAADLPHPADGLVPGQVREVIAGPHRGQEPLQLSLAETVHQLPPASLGRPQVQVRPDRREPCKRPCRTSCIFSEF